MYIEYKLQDVFGRLLKTVCNAQIKKQNHQIGDVIFESESHFFAATAAVFFSLVLISLDIKIYPL